MTVKQANDSVKILVVDDQAGIRLTLKGILAKRGYQVAVAENGEEAVEAVRQNDFRVIFMDVKMPGMSGVDTFIKIKSIAPKATVIMMTAYAVEDELKRAIREGAYAVVYKPFEIDKILGIVEECLERKTLVLVVDDFVDARDMLKNLLETKGFKVVDVESGEECLQKVKERRFQIILMDIKLPGIDGVETLKQVKQIRPDVAVVMLTGYSLEQAIKEAMQSGSFACLNKPIDVDRLLKVVDQCLEQERGGRDA